MLAIPNLAAALTSAATPPLENELLRTVHDNLVAPELCAIGVQIDEIIKPDAKWKKRAAPRLLECLFSVRNDDYSLLEACRQTLTDSTDDSES